MIAELAAASARHRKVVLVIWILGAVLAAFAAVGLRLDALPDVTGNQVQIAAERREEVFHAGARGPASTGAGLGLAIVRQIVTEHGGEVWIADAAPGAELVVELPVG